MYKDKDKQREANRERQRRYREKHKGVTSEGVTDKVSHMEILPLDDRFMKPERRGKDITKLEHLPIDVQRTIVRLTTNEDGTVDEQARANRTAIAVNYQHLFPDRYHNTGVALSEHKYKDAVYVNEASIYNEG